MKFSLTMEQSSQLFFTTYDVKMYLKKNYSIPFHRIQNVFLWRNRINFSLVALNEKEKNSRWFMNIAKLEI